MPRGGAGVIRTAASRRPRSASFCAMSPPIEWPTTAGVPRCRATAGGVGDEIVDRHSAEIDGRHASAASAQIARRTPESRARRRTGATSVEHRGVGEIAVDEEHRARASARSGARVRTVRSPTRIVSIIASVIAVAVAEAADSDGRARYSCTSMPPNRRPRRSWIRMRATCSCAWAGFVRPIDAVRELYRLLPSLLQREGLLFGPESREARRDAVPRRVHRRADRRRVSGWRVVRRGDAGAARAHRRRAPEHGRVVEEAVFHEFRHCPEPTNSATFVSHERRRSLSARDAATAHRSSFVERAIQGRCRSWR